MVCHMHCKKKKKVVGTEGGQGGSEGDQRAARTAAAAAASLQGTQKGNQIKMLSAERGLLEENNVRVRGQKKKHQL